MTEINHVGLTYVVTRVDWPRRSRPARRGARQRRGQPLGDGDDVIGADLGHLPFAGERSPLKTLRRAPPGTTAWTRARTRRVEHADTRDGTLAYFVVDDVHRARVIGTTAPKSGIEPFADLVTAVMTTAQYASARWVLWVVDKGVRVTDNGEHSIEWMGPSRSLRQAFAFPYVTRTVLGWSR